MQTSDSTVHLRDVLLIPEASEHLISVRHATKRGVDFKFSNDRCEISHNGNTLAVAPSTGDAIYYLNGHSMHESLILQPAMIARQQETAQLWHERFGHLGYDRLAQLPSLVRGMNISPDEFKTAGADICEPCVLGKQHRTSFKRSSGAATRPLALLHTDLCGPLPITSIGGNNYFLTILDDYSKFSVVQPIPHKKDTTRAVKDIINLLENQTGQTVQRLRSDNGSEFINQDLQDFCSDRGIKMETTVRTHRSRMAQQNG
jgi:hypothetical protein